MKDVSIIGIVDNYIYIAPLFGGDNIHEAHVSDFEKWSLLEQGVKKYSDIFFIYLANHGDCTEYLSTEPVTEADAEALANAKARRSICDKVLNELS